MTELLKKLEDRYHLLKTLRDLPRSEQERIALDTLETYAPLAARLGMGHLKGELEDLAFPFAYPDEYRQLASSMKVRYADHIRYIERVRPLVKRHLTDAGVPVIALNARIKHYYSLYRKLKKYNMDTAKVFDLVALRIIVPDIPSCYAALGILHQHYKPLAGRIKDFIAAPKANGYQSIHTTIVCEKGTVVEVQIRTSEMHDHAEHGIAAHWAYSASGKKDTSRAKQSTTNMIFIFTPLGDIKELPEGSTPIDFAYAVHTGLGHTTGGAKVNDKMVSLGHVLASGDTVEILKNKKAKPSRGWLSFAKTSEARKRIRASLRSAVNR
jgi:guanosine-3',5'-bis(diphosphate) 3'-pyrophosphohydrolase